MRNKQGKLITPEISWKDITPGGIVYESGSAKNFKTGDWRRMKPVFKADKCKQCLLCVPTCPDSSIPVIAGKRGDFNFEHCKGCGICAKACPFDAIDFIKDQK
jgi:pyruvate ferredoxin oxidoreductase delta subunit